MQNAFISSVGSALGAAAMERITLLLNHVIAAEPVASERLRPYAARRIQLQWAGWPALLPALPPLAFAITPAGLLEWCAEPLPAAADLQLSLDASNPLRLLGQWLQGERPALAIAGDAALAAEVSWLIDNLRWDIEDDVARIVGEAPAHALARAAGAISAGLREAVAALQRVAARSGGSGPR